MSRWFRASSDASGRRLAWAVVAMFAAVGCEGSVPAVGDAALDTAIDSAVDVPVAACPADQTRCEGRCVDMAIDRSNCGACGRTCATGQVCVASACRTSCPAGQTVCGGRCVSINSDSFNCGACAAECPTGQVCSEGACALRCAAPLTECGGAASGDGGVARRCADTRNDRENCGACGTRCEAGQVCEGGACVVSCVAGETVCSGRCIDTQTDRAHCGACGMACAAGQICTAGACRTSCPAGQEVCGDRCVSLTTDSGNCGMCGAACATGQACAGGRCEIACPTGQTACGAACVTTATDPANCGACGMACPTGQVCSEGACRSGCSGTLTECVAGGVRLCADTQTDRRNCGTCGTACGAGQSCAAGVCVTSCPTGQAECGGVCATLANDPAHCGACGVSCAAGQRCVSGACVTSCPTGQTVCSGLCVSTASDVSHCGACGAACEARTNAAATCAAGACRYACSAGFGDCNGMAADGCETSTVTSVAHCGGCGMACTVPANARATCAAGACGFACNDGFADCNGMAADGCEVDLLANASNCGRCGVACPARANAAPTCASGMCAFACASGFDDCDGAAANGCEVTLASNVSHCGACGNVCPARANSAPACAAGACGVACTTGFGDCNATAADGCEVDLRTTASNCGACGTVCPAFAVCNVGACSTCIVAATGDLALPTGATPTTVTGTLPAVSATALNRVTTMSCRATTAGTEHIYTLTVTAPTPLQIYTTGTTDPTISIRRNCLDGASELACDDDGGASLNATIRAVFAPGTYYVVVDSNSTSSVAYTLNVANWAAASNPTCATATPLVDGTTLTAQNPAGGGDRTTQCQSTAEGGQLFYSVTVPSGRRATLTLTQTSAIARTLAMRAFDACPTTACTASLSTSALTAQTLTLDNVSAAPRTFFVGVSAGDMAIADATFTLGVVVNPTPLPYVFSSITAACDTMTGGTAVTFISATSDDSYSAIAALPFTLPYFGATASHYSVTTNGFMQLWTSATGTPVTSFSNSVMTSAANGMVAPFWDDLAFPSAESYGAVTRDIDDAAGRRFVVQWTNFADYSAATARLTFQAKLFASGVIEMHYCAMTNSNATANRHLGDSATVGVRSIDGTGTLQVGTNTIGLTRPGTGYRIAAP